MRYIDLVWIIGFIALAVYFWIDRDKTKPDKKKK